MQRIRDLMTRQPWTVQLDDSLAVARRMIAEREIHHLPVLDGGEVVGIVTEPGLSHAADHLGTVEDVLESALTVSDDTPIDEVLDLMMSRRSDAVVVTGTDGGEVHGIFTATDAVRALREVLRLPQVDDITAGAHRNAIEKL